MYILIILGLFTNFGINWDPVYHRLRCNGHIINLTAQAFIFPESNPDALSQENNEGILAIPTEDEVIRWRKKGPLGKLHNIVVYIQRSTQRRAQFKALSSGLGLIRDNDTRWNSWYLMLVRAIRLEEAIDLFCLKFKENDEDYRKLTSLQFLVFTNYINSYSSGVARLEKACQFPGILPGCYTCK